MRKLLVLLYLLGAAWEGRAAIALPALRVLAGPVDDAKSSMGDTIRNYPFGSGVGSVNIHGWVSVEFDPPAGNTAKFRIRWHAVGDVPLFSFATGHFLHVTGEQNLNSSLQLSQGLLNLDTGEVTNLDVHAIFQNVLIQKSSKYDRLPLVSDASSFSALFVDFPALDFPFPLPFTERPVTSQTARFVVDATQHITGFEFHGVSFIPITVLPALGIMPPYAFGRKGVTIVPGMEGCLPGTTPDSACLAESRLPDGIDSPDDAYLSPFLHLVTPDLREILVASSNPPVSPGGPAMGAAAAGLSGRLYVTGGSDGQRVLSRSAFFDPSGNDWTTLPDMQQTVWQHCSAGVGAKVYVVGGRDGIGRAPVSNVQVFDTLTRTWSSGAPVPLAAAAAGCAVLDSRIYFFGGVTATAAATDAAWVFDTVSGRWSALPRMSLALAGTAAATLGREIWIINGTTDGTTATNRVFVYSPDSGSWREGPASVRGVYGASAATLGNRIYVAGGRTAPGGPLDVGNVLYHSQTMQILSGGSWWAGLYPPLPAARMAGGVVGDTWYLVGGDTAATVPASPTGIVQAFSTTKDWAVSDTHPVFATQTVVNAAGLGTGAAELAPGTMASILGANLVQTKLTAPPVRFDGQYFTSDLPDELGGIRIKIDGRPTGILSVSPNRIDFQMPFGIATSGPAVLSLSRNGVEAPPVTLRMASSAPGIFTYTYGETRAIDILNEAAAIATNGNGTLNYPSQPARPGETVTLRVTGLGEVTPRPAPLQRAPRTTGTVSQIPEVLIDGKPAVVQSVTLVPGEAGLYDVRVTVPANSRVGVRVSVQLRANGILSNPAVMVVE